MNGTEKTYRAGTFRFGDGGPVVDGITDGTTWNGWANVYVTREVLAHDLRSLIEDVLAMNGMDATVIIADDGTDARIVYDDMDEPDNVLPVVIHDGATFYGLIDGWTWVPMDAYVPCPVCKGEGATGVGSPVETVCKRCNAWGYIDRDDA